MTTATKEKKPTEAARFSFEGESKEIPAARGYDMRSRYRQAAAALAAAKAACFDIEEEIKLEHGGFEHLTVDGERISSWIWKDLTTFDKKGLKAEAPELIEKFTVTKPNGSRAFSVPGTAGVE